MAMLAGLGLAVAALSLADKQVARGSNDTAGPTISNVVVRPTTVAAGASFTLSFDLEDPSGLADLAGSATWNLPGTSQL